jgi:hypothetical protein
MARAAGRLVPGLDHRRRARPGAHRSVSCSRRTASSLGSLEAAARRPGIRFRMVSIQPPPPLAAAAAVGPSAVSCAARRPAEMQAQAGALLELSPVRVPSAVSGHAPYG